MAKTQYAGGSSLGYAWLNTVYGTGTSGGHKHDAVDSDGHCDKINLQTETSGTLPSYDYVPPRGFIDGLSMTYYSGGGGVYGVTFGLGACRDSVLTTILINSSTMTKFVTSPPGTSLASWGGGSGTGGVAPGATAPTAGTSAWFHCFAIGSGIENYVPDFGFDTSLTAANLLATSGYNRYRRVGSILVSNTAGTFTILQWIQNHDQFYWTNPYRIIYFKSGSGGIQVDDHTLVAGGPTGVGCEVDLRVFTTTGIGQDTEVFISPPSVPNWTPNWASAYLPTCLPGYGADHMASQVRVHTEAGYFKINLSIHGTLPSINEYCRIAETGWRDYRGRDE